MPMRYYLLLFLFISLLLSGCNKNPEDEKSSVVSSETVKPSQASAIEAVVPNKTLHLRAESGFFYKSNPFRPNIYQTNPRAESDRTKRTVQLLNIGEGCQQSISVPEET